jgi:hypothetical protein
MTPDRGLLGTGRIPGPLGLQTTFGAVRNTSPALSKRAIKIFEPTPADGWDSSLQMKDYAGKPIVFIPPEVDEVRQGRTGNCPVLATLAALAHAARYRVKNMISTRGAKVTAQVTDTSQPTPGNPLTITEETVLYKVRFAKGDPVEVSGLLWTRRGKPEYALSTRDALWPSIIEKGYVVEHGGNSYQRIFGSVTPHEAMTNMLGPVNELLLKNNPGNLIDMLRNAPIKPTIADTWLNLPANLKVPAGIIGFHTYAVLNYSKSKGVRVYNVLDGAKPDVPIATFRQAFESVIQLRA